MEAIAGPGARLGRGDEQAPQVAMADPPPAASAPAGGNRAPGVEDGDQVAGLAAGGGRPLQHGQAERDGRGAQRDPQRADRGGQDRTAGQGHSPGIAAIGRARHRGVCRAQPDPRPRAQLDPVPGELGAPAEVEVAPERAERGAVGAQIGIRRATQEQALGGRREGIDAVVVLLLVGLAGARVELEPAGAGDLDPEALQARGAVGVGEFGGGHADTVGAGEGGGEMAEGVVLGHRSAGE
jgi:hypothetical protein